MIHFLKKKNDFPKMRIFGDTWKLSKTGKMLSNNKKKAFFRVRRIRRIKQIIFLHFFG
jgi:hypothetical protein